MALAASYAVLAHRSRYARGEWFIAFLHVRAGHAQLQNVEAFRACSSTTICMRSAGFPIPNTYPYAEGAAGVLMAAVVLTWLSCRSRW